MSWKCHSDTPLSGLGSGSDGLRGSENPDGFRFCGSCGAALAEGSLPSREVRKTVTVVFCDLTGSTSLGAQLDPEAARATMRRYYDEAHAAQREAIGSYESKGATVPAEQARRLLTEL